MLSKKANQLYNIMEKVYIKEGYLYSGCVTENEDLILELFENNYKEFLQIFKELKINNLVQKRNCQGFGIELTKDERKKLIDKYNLAKVWEMEAPYFYPNSEYGEIFKVLN